MVQKYVPTAVMSMNMGSEVVFQMDPGYRPVFFQLFTDIEANFSGLGLNGYGVATTGLEDVLLG